MQRTNDESWDLKTGVGITATMAAAARAVASRGTDPVVNDPFAEALVRAVGLPLFTRLVDGLVDFSDIGAGGFPQLFGIRTSAFDDFAIGACRAGIRQAVILASGLDCRAYRLDWPIAMQLFEVDQHEVIEWKKRTLAKWGHTSATKHHCVGIDLRHDWPAALKRAGFDTAKPTAWIAEGILIGFLPPDAQNELLDAITALSAAGSRIVADYVDSGGSHELNEYLNSLDDIWCQHDPKLNLRNLIWAGPRDDPAVYLAERGWITRHANLSDLFRAAGRPAPAATDLPESPQFMRFLNGIRN